MAFFALVALIGPASAIYEPTAQVMADRLKPPGAAELFRHRRVRTRYLQPGALRSTYLLPGWRDRGGHCGSAGHRDGVDCWLPGGSVDNLLTLLMDIVFAFPAILLAIAIISMLGNNLTNAMIAIAIVYVPTFMRVVRGATLSVRHSAYVESAVGVGGLDARPGAPHLPQHHRAADRAGFVELRVRGARRSLARLPRARRQAARAVVGLDGQRLLRVPATGSLGGDCAGGSDCPCRAGIQPA